MIGTRIRAVVACGVFLVSCDGSSGGTTSATTCLPDELQAHFDGLSASGQVSFEQIDDAASIKYRNERSGGAFTARDGDYLIENDRIRAVIQGPSRQHFVGNYGGTLIDADVQRADGVWRDVMGEISPLIGVSYLIDAQDIRTLRNGRDGVLVVQASGPLELMDFVNLPGGVKVLGANFTSGGGGIDLQVPWDLDNGIPLVATNYYVLTADAAHIEVHTAICNPTDRAQLTTMTDFIDSGGDVSTFNSNSVIDGEPGFGLELSPTGLFAEADLLAYSAGDAGYALKMAGSANGFGYAGIGILLHGTDEGIPFLSGLLLGFDHVNPPPGYYRLGPGESAVVSRDVIVFDSFNDMTSKAYEIDGVATGRVSGTLSSGGAAATGTRLAFVSGDRLETILTTNASGQFRGDLRPGGYQVFAEVVGGYKERVGGVQVSAGGQATISPTVSRPAALTFAITGLDASVGTGAVAQPAKVSVVCAGECAAEQTRLFGDTLYDSFADGILTQAYVDHNGKVHVMARRGARNTDRLEILPGTYDVVVSRGLEFSRYTTRVTLGEGQTQHLDVDLDRVVDTAGWISADLHVHMVNSPDSPVPTEDRILTFVGEGVDVLVTTDHDYLTDISPTIRDMGLQDYLASMVGEELTFFDLGHFNAYPLQIDSSQIQNGALDGGGGRGPTLTPQAIFAGLREMGAVDNPVVQVNHGRSLLFGYFSAIQLDSDTLQSRTRPDVFRMDPESPDLVTSESDTGLFSTDFDAFELYNEHLEVNAGLNDLFAFLNIGQPKTGVAVSDTHQWYTSEAGAPRSYLLVGGDFDEPAEITPAKLASTIQDGALMGTNGPLVNLTVVSNADGSDAVLGETANGSDGVKLQVDVWMADWISVDTIDIFSNTADVATHYGDPANAYPEPLFSRRVTDGDFSTAGGQKSIRWTVDWTPDDDAWVVAVARDDESYGDNYPMFPVLVDEDELPFGYTNAVFVDENGNGSFDAPGVVGGLQSGTGAIPLAPELTDQDSVVAFLDWLIRHGGH